MTNQTNPVFELWDWLRSFIEAELDESSGVIRLRNVAPQHGDGPRIVFKDIGVSTRNTSMGGRATRLNPGESTELQVRARDLSNEFIHIEASLDFEQFFRFKTPLEPGEAQLESIRTDLSELSFLTR